MSRNSRDIWEFLDIPDIDKMMLPTWEEDLSWTVTCSPILNKTRLKNLSTKSDSIRSFVSVKSQKRNMSVLQHEPLLKHADGNKSENMRGRDHISASDALQRCRHRTRSTNGQ